MDYSLILTALTAIGGLTAVLSTALVLANRRLFVQEDPRIDAVEEMLPATNCGGCGYPGCRPFAEALVGGEVLPGKCSVSTEEGREQIAGYLGVDAGAEAKQVARLACAGGTNASRNRALYKGIKSCAGAALVAGGGKACFWGCLGIGDCEVSCDFDAITMTAQGLPVVDEDKCTTCGDCVAACPKDLFSLEVANNRLWVACKSQEEGDEVLEDCKVGCTACARCAMDAPGYIEMRGNLPVIDYSRGPTTADPAQRCPTGAIVWLDEVAGAQRGEAAPKLLRRRPLPTEPT